MSVPVHDVKSVSPPAVIRSLVHTISVFMCIRAQLPLNRRQHRLRSPVEGLSRPLMQQSPLLPPLVKVPANSPRLAQQHFPPLACRLCPLYRQPLGWPLYGQVPVLRGRFGSKITDAERHPSRCYWQILLPPTCWPHQQPCKMNVWKPGQSGTAATQPVPLQVC